MSCYIMYGGVTWKSAVLKVAVEVTKVYVYRPLLEHVILAATERKLGKKISVKITFELIQRTRFE